MAASVCPGDEDEERSGEAAADEREGKASCDREARLVVSAHEPPGVGFKGHSSAQRIQPVRRHFPFSLEGVGVGVCVGGVGVM